jgi:nucleoside-diphosphate-sugar epimerase
MPSALIGHTGFVGGNLAAQNQFDLFYNSKNIEEIAGRSVDLLVVSAMPAAMWIANREPEADRAVLDRLAASLRQVRAGRAVLISTTAVYPVPVDVDEESVIDPSAQTPYGRHRLMLEEIVKDHFSGAHVVRLPGLFGNGLKKNVIYDLLHNNEVHKINSAGVYQYYNLDHIWADLQTAMTSGLRLVNFVTSPVTVNEVAREAFDLEFSNDPGTAPAKSAIRSLHAARFGGRAGHLYDRSQVLSELRAFVAREGARQLEH